MPDDAFILSIVARSLYAIYVAFFFIAPYLLLKWFWKCWLKYIRTAFMNSQKNLMLELRPPKEVTRSPLAMEIFIGALYQIGRETTWLDRYWYGKMRPWFSLEIVSIEGTIRFYVATHDSFKVTIESSLYSQFPDMEIFTVRDYTKDRPYDLEKYSFNVLQYEKAKADYFPIQTYNDYGLADDPDDEHKVDSLSSLLEFFANSIGRGEQLWLQIIIRAHKKESVSAVDGTEDVDWTYDAQKYIAKVMQRDKKTNDGEGKATDKLTKAEKDLLDAVERNITKKAFDTGIRVVYSAKKENYNPGMVGSLRGLFIQFQTVHMNGIKGGQDDFDYPWQDWNGNRAERKRARIIEMYRQRAYFPPLYKSEFFFHIPFFRPDSVHKLKKYFVMSSEEIASIFHFPSGTILKTPTIKRAETKRGEAPSNLPI